MQTNVITLRTPIEFDDKTIDTIKIGEPSVGGIEAFQHASQGKEDAGAMLAGTIALLAFENGISADAVRRMRISDLQRVSEALSPFLTAQKEDSGQPGSTSVPTSATS